MIVLINLTDSDSIRYHNQRAIIVIVFLILFYILIKFYKINRLYNEISYTIISYRIICFYCGPLKSNIISFFCCYYLFQKMSYFVCADICNRPQVET